MSKLHKVLQGDPGFHGSKGRVWVTVHSCSHAWRLVPLFELQGFFICEGKVSDPQDPLDTPLSAKVKMYPFVNHFSSLYCHQYSKMDALSKPINTLTVFGSDIT